MAVRTRTEIATRITSLFPDNDTMEISPSDLRSILEDIKDSFGLLTEIPPGGITLDAALAAIRGGYQIDIDRTQTGRITLNYNQGVQPVSHSNYLGLSVDENATPAEFTVSGMQEPLTVPTIISGQMRYILYAKPQAQGAFQHVYYYDDGHRNTINVLGTSFVLGAGTVTLGGEQHLWIRSRVAIGASASGRIVEAG